MVTSQPVPVLISPSVPKFLDHHMRAHQTTISRGGQTRCEANFFHGRPRMLARDLFAVANPTLLQSYQYICYSLIRSLRQNNFHKSYQTFTLIWMHNFDLPGFCWNTLKNIFLQTALPHKMTKITHFLVVTPYKFFSDYGIFQIPFIRFSFLLNQLSRKSQFFIPMSTFCFLPEIHWRCSAVPMPPMSVNLPVPRKNQSLSYLLLRLSSNFFFL